MTQSIKHKMGVSKQKSFTQNITKMPISIHSLPILMDLHYGSKSNCWSKSTGERDARALLIP